MKNYAKKSLKSSNGITLIALVVTIIVLLILAGISISMLSGDNGILQKATTAKTETGVGQEKETIALAYNSALAKKVSNGDSTAVTDGDLNTELTNQGAKAKGNNPITVTFDVSKRQYTINSNGTIEYAGIQSNDDNDIQLSIEEIETESRAEIIRVSSQRNVWADVTDELKINWLKTLSENELKEVYAQVNSGIGKTWADSYTGAPFSNVKELYEYGPKSSGAFTDEYDWIIKAYNNGRLNALYFNAHNKDLPSKVTVVYDNESEEIDYIDKTFVEFVYTKKNGTITITASNTNGSTDSKTFTTSKAKDETYQYPSDKSSNFKLTQDTYEAIIPSGYAYGISSNVGTISNGLVITDNIDNDGNSIGNEFVWIPIDKTTLKVKGTDKPIAIATSGTTNNLPNYQGALYSEFLSNSTPNSNYVQNNTNTYREPAVISSYDKNSYLGEIDLTVSQFTTEIQSEYNKIIASIQNYGGFYVSRYEMGTGTDYSRLGTEVLKESWYKCYGKAKEYANANDTTKSVISNMIYGSQYDAMLNFGLTGLDRTKIEDTNNNSWNQFFQRKTGLWTNGSDLINNIFDIQGNIEEWCQEAYSNNMRLTRIISSRGSTDYWNIWLPMNKWGTRVALYIK